MHGESRRIDRRRFGRKPVSWSGTVTVSCRAPVPCKVRNASREGALIEVDRGLFLPTRFLLAIGAFETQCTVQHRTDGAVGVKFDTAGPDWLT